MDILTEHVIACAELGKAYTIYARPEDRLKEWLKGGHHGDTFWALRDVSLSIRPGQTVGIIGRNGSGKSTFLQMVAGILNPTEGVLHTRGRIAALLELGTGFNPEFTGRENIRLGASLLGLDPDTIEARIPDIAHFADIGHFFDYPVKLYSSGMHARLAFALVAHVDADLLIVDEALAVGDAAFSQKCMGFMREFRNRGTLCFVSHDAAAVINLCDSALWLDHGKLHAFDDARSVCREYQESINVERRGGYSKAKKDPLSSPSFTASAGRGYSQFAIGAFDPEGPWHGFLEARIVDAELTRADDPSCRIFQDGNRVHLRVTARCDKDLASPVIGFSWKDARGQEIFGGNTLAALSDSETLLAGEGFVAEFTFTLPVLRTGIYFITLALAEGDQFNHVHHHWMDEAFTLHVTSTAPVIGIMDIQCECKIHHGLSQPPGILPP
ncbi:MAG: ABC transporter ATP-binding protein [Ferrovum myxofaciens]|nr:MAG: ABC transporter ATP-binding protein [Ferrovum myxofaciens]